MNYTEFVQWRAIAEGADVPTFADRLGRPEWMRQARCRGHDVDVFFSGDTAPGKALCSTCPVSADCLDYALEDRSLAGTWAGTTEVDRRAIRAGKITAVAWLAALEHQDAA